MESPTSFSEIAFPIRSNLYYAMIRNFPTTKVHISPLSNLYTQYRAPKNKAGRTSPQPLQLQLSCVRQRLYRR